MEIKLNELTEEERKVIVEKGTERPFSGKYCDFFDDGVYVCRQCGQGLYRSDDKIRSGCGWPAFDDEIPGAVSRRPDPDGRRVEILCSRCGGHLGHVFKGEKLTPKDTRHCVNSISMEFVPKDRIGTAYFAGGCFWGVEHFFLNEKGVLHVMPGYMGGAKDNPSYKDVCTGKTGHAETVMVVFDRKLVDFRALAKIFFEIHDPTQVDRQGPDVGTQYRSAVFCVDDGQRKTVEELVGILKGKGLKVTTEISGAGRFFPAEEYHRKYYLRTGREPYCHRRVERF